MKIIISKSNDSNTSSKDKTFSNDSSDGSYDWSYVYYFKHF